MEEKIYTTSKGEKIKLKDMNTEHILNSMAKAYRESFSSKDKKEFYKFVDKTNMLKEELYRRMNDFSETLNEEK